jgi:hypothetical protein
LTTPDPSLFEKLGVFYLGRTVDPEAPDDAGGGDLLLYDSRDLLTHALCVGMTGSGKTGLCVTLLEEAALDGVPALVIDPKGDLGNLLLTFPDLAAADFEPWIDPEEAARKGQDIGERAAAVAETWRRGLAEWGENGERIARLRRSADLAIYTPGSEGGRPLSILSSFAAPPRAVMDDPDLLRDRVHTVTASLLGLAGLDTDPVKSRDYILFANLLETLWRRGGEAGTLGLPELVQAVQNPPLSRVGVMDLESFYPAKERFGLALTLNNLLAAPTFQAWTRGEPLDVDRLLYDAAGRPRVSVLHIAHLPEAERMFFVALLLDQVLGWVRTRPGTTSLRALLVMDEIFGYLPPVAEPPSKRPLLTLLKQARAYGLGLVLSTQNPADVDYKALSNLGTWCLGRLQTERDRDRLLAGLLSASGEGLDRDRIERLLAGLESRVFLLHNVHEDEGPVLFKTRWALSYLKGPLTRGQIRILTEKARAEAGGRRFEPETEGRAKPAHPEPEAAAGTAAMARPVLPPSVPQAFLRPLARSGAVFWEPHLLGLGQVHYTDHRRTFDHTEDVALALSLAPEGSGIAGVDWRQASPVGLSAEDLESEPPVAGNYADLPALAASPDSYREIEKDLAEVLYRTRELTLWKNPLLDEISLPGEDARDFVIRLGDAAREARDRETAKLKETYRKKLDRLESRERSALERVEREKDQAGQRKWDTALSFAGTLASAFLGRGRRGTLSRATTAFKGVGRSVKEQADVARAEETLEAIRADQRELEAELTREIDALEERWVLRREDLEEIPARPRRSDVQVERVVLLWAVGDLPAPR